MPLELIDENFNELHWAQAKCYGYMISTEEEFSELDIRLTYCNIETEEIKCLQKVFTKEELQKFFYSLIDKYYVWAKMTYDWNKIRNESIKKLDFPFKGYREGQRELAVGVYKTISSSKNMFIKAPTGIGKTISTIFPAVKAMGEELTSKIFYLTAKTITRSAAEEAFSRMRQGGLKFKTVTLTAKEKICFKDKVKCNPIDCEYAKGHFDRINDALMDLLSNSDDFRRENILKYANDHKVCPFEFALDLTLFGDSVICDYNYVFDPSVYLKRFFSENGGDYVFLIDEAHNLVDRAREMYSAELYKKPIMKLKKDMKHRNKKVAKTLTHMNNFMLDMKKLCDGANYNVFYEQNMNIYNVLNRFVSECEEYLLQKEKSEIYDELLELYFNAYSFIKICELYDDKYVTYIENNDDDIKIKLFCMDPSFLLSEALKRGKSTIFFSATLTPMDYYKEILGGSKEDNILILRSPFNTENRRLLINSSISTKYEKRDKSYNLIVDNIKSVINSKMGNYFVFFPSYKYMMAVHEKFIEEDLSCNVIVQNPSMKEDERESFLQTFKENPEETTIGFCVLGGLFSEGIDLKNDRLIGSIIISVGIPQIGFERDLIRKYFNDKNNQGYEYSYMYPGMNKVLQAAGRVIRTEEDKGIILLIDERFTNYGYKMLYPKDWFPNIIVNSKNLQWNLEEFWSKIGNENLQI